MFCRKKVIIIVIILINLIIFNVSSATSSENSSYAPGEVIVKIKNTVQTQSISQENFLLKKYNVKQVEPLFTAKNVQTTSTKNQYLYFKLILNKDISVMDFIKLHSNDPYLECIEPNYYLSLPYDKSGTFSTLKSNTSISPAYGNRILVAVLDTGIDKEHELIKPFLYINSSEDINNNSRLDSVDLNEKDDDGNGYIDDVIGYDFQESANPTIEDNDPTDNDGHGTHVAGIVINNSSLNGQGYSKILPIKIFDSKGVSTVGSAIKGLNYASALEVKVINCSWGTISDSILLKEVISETIKQDILVVGAAGNENSSTIYYPGAYDDVLTVAALKNDMRFNLSCYGNHIDISAPGYRIYSSWPGNDYTYSSGTSMATAAVSGISALLYYKNTTLSVNQIKNVIFNTADDITDPNGDGSNLIGKDIYTGYGAINLQSALAQIDGNLISPVPLDSSELIISNLLNYPNPASTSTTFGFNLSEDATVEISIFNLNGELVNKLNLSGSKSSYNKVTWDLKDAMGREMGNDVYIFVAKATNTSGEKNIQKGKLAILK